MSPDDVDPDPGTATDQRLQRGDATGAAMDAVDAAVAGDVELQAPSIRDHPIRAALGLVIVVLGIAAVVGVDAVPELPFDATLVTFVAGLSLALGALIMVRRAFAAVSTAETADVEYRESVSVPGTEFDSLLHGAVHGMGGRRLSARQTVVERLREAAVSIYAQAERIPEAEARERVDDGTWTDDAVAAQFLTGESRVSSTSDQVRTLVGRGSKLAAHADRVIAELTELAPGLSAGDVAAGATADPSAGRGDESGSDEDDGDRPEIRRTGAPTRRQVDRRTDRWTGLTGLGLLCIGVGLWASHANVPPGLVVATAVVAGAAGYVYLSSPPPVSLSVEREFAPAEPAPGDEVTVTVSVTNTSDSLAPDLRVVDGVPPAVRVVDGSPRFATALRPEETVSFSYTVEAVRGEHAFDPVHVVVRDFSGALERERHVAAESGAVLAADLELAADESIPVHPHTAQRVGRVVTDTGGSGVELHSVREYQRGDPMSRIDWNRVAATGEFATLLFREEHAATVVLLIDAREEAYVAPRVDARSAVEHSVAAADVVISSLVGAGDSVGLAALSPEWCWLEPRGGAAQSARARRLLETHAAFDGRPPDGDFYGEIEERRLRRELPADAQLLLCSPLCDDGAVAIVRQLHARGFPVTVVSPDVTARATTGQRLAAVERAMRISRLRRSGVRVVDWDTDRPLETALDAAHRRWSA
ncbi:DUF58 domain-containing protein [Halosimplex aquaticum]|uniref:DUF58 domain-containing protein n=1 Tax=Halosimplex aquaticum TaxID=3026162 RepID=A0ABD5XZS7_9EURY|nr:DUF58 domain-containing protein [Halosimplex aquaticum]